MSDIRYYTDGEQATASVLNRPIKDLEFRNHFTTRGDFEARAASNRLNSAGSGFKEWGNASSNSSRRPISLGLYAGYNDWQIDNINDTGSIFQFGYPNNGSENLHTVTREVTGSEGEAVFNGNGYLMWLSDSLTTRHNRMAVPQMPITFDDNVADYLFIEYWHEDISEKGFVFPLGNVRFIGYYPEISGLNSYIDANYCSSYEGENYKGKGFIWDNLSDDDKIKFISDPKNNIYLDGDTIVQVRFRFRWARINLTHPLLESSIQDNSGVPYLHFRGTTGILKTGNPQENESISKYIAPQGKRTLGDFEIESIDATISSNGWYDSNERELSSDDKAKYDVLPGTYIASISASGTYSDIDDKFGYEGRCFASPMLMNHRRNAGVFNQFTNINGSGQLQLSDWEVKFDKVNSLWQVVDGNDNVIKGKSTSNHEEMNAWLRGKNLDGSLLEPGLGVNKKLTFFNDAGYRTGTNSFAYNATFLERHGVESIYGSNSTLFNNRWNSYKTHSSLLFKIYDNTDRWITFDVGEAKIPRKIIVTGESQHQVGHYASDCYAAGSFTLFGSNTGSFSGEESTIYSGTGSSLTEGYINEKNVIKGAVTGATTAFRYYKFKFQDISQRGISQIELFEDENAQSGFVPYHHQNNQNNYIKYNNNYYKIGEYTRGTLDNYNNSVYFDGSYHGHYIITDSNTDAEEIINSGDLPVFKKIDGIMVDTGTSLTSLSVRYSVMSGQLQSAEFYTNFYMGSDFPSTSVYDLRISSDKII